jgi:hypothetical protein
VFARDVRGPCEELKKKQDEYSPSSFKSDSVLATDRLRNRGAPLAATPGSRCTEPTAAGYPTTMWKGRRCGATNAGLHDSLIDAVPERRSYAQMSGETIVSRLDHSWWRSHISAWHLPSVVR